MPEPNIYRPYIEGMDPEASALACLEIGLKMFDMASAGRAAAIIVEPVISAGGVLRATEVVYAGAAPRGRNQRGMLLIFDEAQTAFGRIGHRTAADFFGVAHHEPVQRPWAAACRWRPPSPRPPSSRTSTRRASPSIPAMSDPLPATVGLAVLDTLKREHLMERARTSRRLSARRLLLRCSSATKP